MDPLTGKAKADMLLRYREDYRHLTASLAGVGLIWPGSLQRRRLTCGKPQCGCHQDPERRHGPYWYWTSKKEGKTISRKLSEPEAEIIQPWINNRRQIELTLRQMEQISRQMLSVLLSAGEQGPSRGAGVAERRRRKRIHEGKGR
jgi:hypothetical protein